MTYVLEPGLLVVKRPSVQSSLILAGNRNLRLWDGDWEEIIGQGTGEGIVRQESCAYEVIQASKI